MDDKESKVKKIVFSVIAACSLFALFGCNHRAETDTVQPAAMEELKPMQQSWRGVLPCADCEGIDTSLFLEKDGTWVMNEHYQGARREPSSFASYGTWARTADKLVLTDSKGEKSYFRAKGDKLEMLDRNGSPVQSPLNYTLEPVKASLPTTPMAMRGMYFYMADAATFTDCATGKRVAVANNAQLERDYAAARGNDSRPVLLVVEARQKSGTMSTVAHAERYGKPVFAVPGSIYSANSAGTNGLLREGRARAVCTARDLMEPLRLHPVKTAPAAADRQPGPLDETGRRVLACIGPKPVGIEELCVNTGLPTALLLSTLMKLELSGRGFRQPGQRYVLR